MKKLYLICDTHTDNTLLNFFRAYVQETGGLSLELVEPDKDGFTCPTFDTKSPVVFAAGHADEASSPGLLEAVVLHTLEGGELLMLAGGMMSTQTHEWALLSSARLLRKQPYGEVTIETADNELTKGLTSAQLWDEQCFFERSVFDNSTALVCMKLGQQKYPVIWTRPWYLGKVYCVGSMLVPSALAAYAPVVRNILNVMVKEG